MSVSCRSGFLRILALTLAFACSPTPAAGSKQDWPGYIPVEPPIVVNLASRGRARFVQIGAQFYVERPEDAEIVQKHMPLIRDRMILFFGGREEQAVREVASRETLRAQLTQEIRDSLRQQTGKYAVEEVYFTNFVIQ